MTLNHPSLFTFDEDAIGGDFVAPPHGIRTRLVRHDAESPLVKLTVEGECIPPAAQRCDTLHADQEVREGVLEALRLFS
jgi:hypothetical protein